MQIEDSKTGFQSPILNHQSSIRNSAIPYFASILSGMLLFVSFPKPDWHLFAWIAVSPLLGAIATETRGLRSFLFGYLTGLVFLAGSCYWLIDVLHRYGALNIALAVGVLVLFVMVFSLFFGAFGLIEGWTARRSQTLALLLSPFLWVLMELARTYLITGFPWNLLGYAVHAVGLRQIASFAAVYGLSFLAVATAAGITCVFLEPRKRKAQIVLATWIGVLLVANWLSTPKPVAQGSNVAVLVQPDVPLGDAAQGLWAPWRDPAPLKRLVALTTAAVRGLNESGSPLVIWSENPAPFYFNRDAVFRGAIEKMARENHAYAVISTVGFVGQDNTKPRNSAVVVDPRGDLVFQYDKIHLVPFGEYVPWWAFPGQVGKITNEVGDFVPGSKYRAARTREGSISILICYEAIFPQLVRRLVSDGPGVLVNISNDAWYGDSAAAFQHLEMARLRAIENGRFLLRATNDGVTAVIDPYGRVVQQIPRHRAMALRGRFNYVARRTFYTAHGDVFAWTCAAAAAVIVAIALIGENRKIEEGM